MLCEEKMTIVETRSTLSIPQSTKQVTSPKTQSNIGKTNKYCTNCGMNNHKVETCKKKDETTMATIEATQQSEKPQKTFSYACHIYGLNGHKMIDYSRFIEMQKMFHGKSVTIIKVQHVVKIKTFITKVNVVDVNVTTRNKANEEHVFKDKELRKANIVVNQDKEEQLKKWVQWKQFNKSRTNNLRQKGHSHPWRNGT